MLLLLTISCKPVDNDTKSATDDSFSTTAYTHNQSENEIDALLSALPNVRVDHDYTEVSGYTRYNLHFTQLIDHDHPEAGTFQQQATLMHRDESAPMVLVSTGYWNYYEDALSEPTQILNANQLVVEHRYFAESRPQPADWTLLTIYQAAADHHDIITLLKSIYKAAWISTGASKGGMTSIYHRRFWPDDVAGTIPYVAPISFGNPDTNYQTFYDQIGTEECRNSLWEVAAEMLKRRSRLEKRAESEMNAGGWTYERVPVGPALESSVQSLYWSFWQYLGIDYCSIIPATTASDDDLWYFLEGTSPVESASDIYLSYFEAYYFQADVELGYPSVMDPGLEGLLQYSEADWEGMYPVGVARPAFRPEAMEDVSNWLQTEGDHFVFLYGEYDPWTGGRFEIGEAKDTVSYTVPQGSHLSLIADLPEAEREDAISRIEAWAGVSGDTATVHSIPSPLPFEPPLLHFKP